MIEIPRGAPDRRRDRGKEASFFSFGTNDLTQMAFGYSRDDAEGGFLLKYVEEKVLPFKPLPDHRRHRCRPVGRDRRRRRAAPARPDIELGVCGEHGGDPESIHFFDEGRPGLCELLAVPRAGGTPGRRASRAGTRQAAKDPLDPRNWGPGRCKRSGRV